jgi:hypothetical protein
MEQFNNFYWKPSTSDLIRIRSVFLELLRSDKHMKKRREELLYIFEVDEPKET